MESLKNIFIQIDDWIIDEEDADPHAKWILADSASIPLFRSIPGGAIDQQITKGEYTLLNTSSYKFTNAPSLKNIGIKKRKNKIKNYVIKYKLLN